MLLDRRRALHTLLFGAGYVGLRSLATGIPIAILADPRKALADGLPAVPVDPSKAQYLIMTSSSQGDPLNGNVPGTYLDSKIKHPLSPTMQATAMNIGGATYQAAAPWASLPANITARTCFFHNCTNTNVHPNQSFVMTLGGALRTPEMLASFIAAQTAPALGTVQPEPVSLGAQSGETLSFQGNPQPALSPTALAAALSSPTGPIAKLQSLRDADLKTINAYFKANGAAAQANFVDEYALSRTQVRDISQTLLSQLHAIQDDSMNSQLQAAAILIQMKFCPAYTVHIPFGGDNHSDPNLDGEAAQQVSALAAINTLLETLTAAGIGDKVTFASLNVFGRTLSLDDNGTNGRDHNAGHCCGVMIGKGVKGSVIGGVANAANALPIVSSTGMGDPSGDIAQQDTMAAYGMTLSAAMGIPSDTIAAEFRPNTAKIVAAALAT